MFIAQKYVVPPKICLHPENMSTRQKSVYPPKICLPAKNLSTRQKYDYLPKICRSPKKMSTKKSATHALINICLTGVDIFLMVSTYFWPVSTYLWPKNDIFLEGQEIPCHWSLSLESFSEPSPRLGNTKFAGLQSSRGGFGGHSGLKGAAECFLCDFC